MRHKVTFINAKNESTDFYYKPFVINSVEGLSEMESDDYTYSGYRQDGEVYVSAALRSRKIDVQFTIMASSVEELLKKRQSITQILNPKLGVGELIYTYQGVTRKIYCAVSKLLIDVKSKRTYSKAQLTLTAYDPYFYDLLPTKISVATWHNALKFPLTIPRQGMIFGYKEPSLIANIINEGDIECGLTIEFIAKGTVKNPSLLNINTQEFIKVNRTMTAGEKIIISTGYNEKRITSIIDGQSTNIMNHLDLESTFLQLTVGDNLFRYDAEQNLSNLEVNIYYTQRYLGV